MFTEDGYELSVGWFTPLDETFHSGGILGSRLCDGGLCRQLHAPVVGPRPRFSVNTGISSFPSHLFKDGRFSQSRAAWDPVNRRFPEDQLLLCSHLKYTLVVAGHQS
jgi:hypothetical protein